MTAARLQSVFGLILLLSLSTCQTFGAAEVDVKETPLGSTRKIAVKSLTPSPDGQHLAFVTLLGKTGVQLVLDGKPDPTNYEGLAAEGIVFSPDSKHVAFIAQSKTKWVIVADGKASEPYNTYAKGSLAFNADGSRWLVTADQGGKRLLLLNGQPGKTYDDVSHPHFSADGKHVAYGARVGAQWFPVIDTFEGPACDALLDETVIFSPDSNSVAYAAKTGGKWVIVSGTISADGSVHPAKAKPAEYDDAAAGTLVFSPDGKRLACGMSHGPNWVLVDNGVEGKPCDRIIAASLVFSPDGKSVSYVGERDGGKMLVITDGVDGSLHQSVEVPPVYSGDSKHIACIGRDVKEIKAEGNKISRPKLVSEFTFILDGKPVGTYDNVLSRPIFCPDGSRLAYAALRDKHVFVVVDGKEGAAFDEILQTPVFSADSKRLAYPMRRGKQQFAVIDGKESDPYDAVGRLSFSPDSKHVAYAAQSGGDLHLYLDTAATSDFTGIMHGSALAFDTPTSFNTFVFRSTQIETVHVELKPEK